MASASSLAHFNSASRGAGGERGLETIEIDPQFAEGLEFREGDVVEIGLLHDLGYATSVATEPLTSDDWEILEIHASHVESTLLSQVRVAAIDQEIDVWVLGRTRVRLKVVSLEPSNGKALLLTTSTEVSIAPKTRSRMPNGTSKSGIPSKLNGLPTAVSAQPSKSTSELKTKPLVFRVLPKRVLPPISPNCSALDDGSVAAIIFVSRMDLRQMSQLRLREFCDLVDGGKCWKGNVKRLLPPEDPTRAQNDSGAAGSAPPVPRILVPTDSKAAQAAVQPTIPTDEVLLVWSPKVPLPDGYALVHGSVADVEDYDNIVVIMKDVSEHKVEFEAPHASSISNQSGNPPPKLAGVDKILKDCVEFCEATYFAQLATKSKVRGVPGLLITGRPGAGKTSILNAVARHLQDSDRTYSYVLRVDLAQYVASPIPKIKTLLNYWFEKAHWHRPSVIVFDNMDKLMAAEQEHAESFRQRHITELFIHYYSSSFRTVQPDATGLVFIASAESKAALHPNLMATHMFKETVHLQPPGKDERKEMLTHLVRTHTDVSDLSEDPTQPLNYTALAMETEGYLITDLKDLVARAVHQAAIRIAEHEDDEGFQPTLLPDDFTKAHKGFVPLSLRDVPLHKSDVIWADIGGLRETKRVIRETLEWPTKYAPIFAQSPLRLRQGLLLYGYPGCGKTLIASAVAKECGLNFISVKGPELLNKYIGASEQSVRELFDRASAAKPCVLFFDEFDSIAPKRGHDSTGVTDRVVNQLLTQLDGVEGLDGVYVLAATSRPDLIDSALLRPGRLDKSLLCDMPDAQDRKEILEAVSRKVKLSPSINLEDVARDTEGFSGADLQALIYNAHLEVVHEAIAASKLHPNAPSSRNVDDEDDIGPVQYTTLFGRSETKKVMTRAEEEAMQRRLRRMIANTIRKPADSAREATSAESKPVEQHEIREEHIQRVLKTTRPSVPPQERERLWRIYHAFVDDRSGELPVPPDAGGIGLRATLM
ncbi:unnamed protein product [Somion occarium]